MIKDLEITTYEGDPLFFSLKEPRIKSEVTPYFMARIVDAEQFLKEYEFASSEKCKITLTDDYAPWNNGTYQLENGRVIRLNDAKGDISLSINALAAALLGYKRPAELCEIGELEGNDEAITVLDRIIPARKSFFIDFF
jgi:predicted acetyltransferase